MWDLAIYIGFDFSVYLFGGDRDGAECVDGFWLRGGVFDFIIGARDSGG